jgi:hypothetical protein
LIAPARDWGAVEGYLKVIAGYLGAVEGDWGAVERNLGAVERELIVQPFWGKHRKDDFEELQ